jgi:hypothetical protein
VDEVQGLRELVAELTKKIEALERQSKLASEFLQKALEALAKIEEKNGSPL